MTAISANEKPKRKPTFLIRIMQHMFRWNGHFVADHPWLVIVASLLLALVCGLKIPLTKRKDDLLLGYTPTNARARQELFQYSTFSKGDPLMLVIFVVAADGGSMARVAQLNETVKLIDQVGSNFRVNNLSFFDMCTSFCNVNEPVAIFRNGLVLHEASVRSGVPPDFEKINLTFPMISLLGSTYDLSVNFYGVQTRPSYEAPEGALTNVKDVRLICLIFRANRPASWTDDDAAEWDRKIGRFYREVYKNPLIVPKAVSHSYGEDEVVRCSEAVIPYVVVGFIFMVVFSVAAVYIGAIYVKQWTYYKVIFAIAACISPILATATTLGLLFYFGFRFGSILLFTPFLVLGIGINDAFIIVNMWERICADRMRNRVPMDTLRDRMGELVVDTGPSVLLTSLTNFLAFGTGYFSPTPEISLFCAANAIAMIFDYFYTMLPYMAVIALGGQREMRTFTNKRTADNDRKTSRMYSFLLAYSEWLSSYFTSVIVLFLLVLYWSFSLYGIASVKTGLDGKKLFLSDSPILEVKQLQNQYLRPERTTVTILINRAGELRNATRVARVASLAAEMEAMPECNGAQFTKLWLRDYQNFIQMEVDGAEEEGLEESDGNSTSSLTPYSPESIQQFLAWPEYKQWSGFMNVDDRTHRVESFFFLVAYHGNLGDYNEKLRLLRKWRHIVDSYSDLSASVFDDDAQFTDQIESLIPLTWQSCLFTFVCMIVMCVLFMDSFSTIFIAAFSMFSIFIGVAGFLVLWGIDLDPLSMAIIVLAIGLSVDYPTHITYHFHRTFYTAEKRSNAERLAEALSVIGYPVLQCSAANGLYTLSIIFVHSYTTQVIIKTIVLVVACGTLHALLVIPAMLCTVGPRLNILRLRVTDPA